MLSAFDSFYVFNNDINIEIFVLLLTIRFVLKILFRLFKYLFCIMIKLIF